MQRIKELNFSHTHIFLHHLFSHRTTVLGLCRFCNMFVEVLWDWKFTVLSPQHPFAYWSLLKQSYSRKSEQYTSSAILLKKNLFVSFHPLRNKFIPDQYRNFYFKVPMQTLKMKVYKNTLNKKKCNEKESISSVDVLEWKSYTQSRKKSSYDKSETLSKISKVQTTIWGLKNINSPHHNFILLKYCSN